MATMQADDFEWDMRDGGWANPAFDDDGPTVTEQNVAAAMTSSDEASPGGSGSSGPRPLFCQLSVLDGDLWRESNRWVCSAYEQCVLVGACRWSAPRVSPTSLGALQDAEAALTAGGVTLDPALTVPNIAAAIIAALTTNNKINAEQSEQLRKILLQPHLHQHRKKEDVFKKTTYFRKPHKRLERSLGRDVEVVHVLVGAVPFLHRTLALLVRLAEPTLLPDWTPVNRPTRFVFVALGPGPECEAATTVSGDVVDRYREMGRAVAAMFMDQEFRLAAFCARRQAELLRAMSDYRRRLAVLPPAVWEAPPSPWQHLGGGSRQRADTRRGATRPTHVKIESPYLCDGSYNEVCDVYAHQDESLKRTGRLCGGLASDLRRLPRRLVSDLRDALHPQCLAAVALLYIASLTHTVLLPARLDTQAFMGPMECLLSVAGCGAVFALLSGQPLTILAPSTPTLLLDALLYHLATDYHWDFLSFRFCVGVWVSLFLMLVVTFDLSALVAYVTRFTEESFCVVMAVIFVAEAIRNMTEVLHQHPVHLGVIHEDVALYQCHCRQPDLPPNVTTATNVTARSMFDTYNWSTLAAKDCINIFYELRLVVSHACLAPTDCTRHGWELVGAACNNTQVTLSEPDVFLFSLFLFFGTALVAYALHTFRDSNFFPAFIRQTVGDFAVVIAILLWCGLDVYVGINTPKLHVPSEIKPAGSRVSWLVDVRALSHWWLVPLAAAPAVMAAASLATDLHITGRVIAKQHPIKKPGGVHLDLAVLAVLVAACSTLGLPWCSACTVRSVTHVRVLSVRAPRRLPLLPGETVVGVREQRVTGLLIHLLIGCSLLFSSVLQYVPLPVIYGVFLYMGLTALAGHQFIERLLLLLRPPGLHPAHRAGYARHMRAWRVHVFTAVQAASTAAMGAVRSSSAGAVGFPVVVALVCCVRRALDRLFTGCELSWLDQSLPTSLRAAEATPRERADGTEGGLDEATHSPLYGDGDGAPTWENPDRQISEDESSNHSVL